MKPYRRLVMTNTLLILNVVLVISKIAHEWVLIRKTLKAE